MIGSKWNSETTSHLAKKSRKAAHSQSASFVDSEVTGLYFSCGPLHHSFHMHMWAAQREKDHCRNQDYHANVSDREDRAPAAAIGRVQATARRLCARGPASAAGERVSLGAARAAGSLCVLQRSIEILTTTRSLTLAALRYYRHLQISGPRRGRWCALPPPVHAVYGDDDRMTRCAVLGTSAPARRRRVRVHVRVARLADPRAAVPEGGDERAVCDPDEQLPVDRDRHVLPCVP